MTELGDGWKPEPGRRAIICFCSRKTPQSGSPKRLKGCDESIDQSINQPINQSRSRGR